MPYLCHGKVVGGVWVKKNVVCAVTLMCCIKTIPQMQKIHFVAMTDIKDLILFQ